MENKKKRNPLNLITVISSSVIFTYHFICLCLCLAGFDSTVMGAFSLLVMAYVFLPVIFADKLRKFLKKAFRALHIIFTVLMCIYIVTAAALWVYICIGAGHTADVIVNNVEAVGDTGEDTAILVFGCRAHGYSPSLTLRLRLDAAYKLLNAMPDAVCIVSGGQGSNETVPESEAMEAYLVGRGIDKSRIIKESDSHSTSENIRLTKQLIDESGRNFDKIIGVSTAFHLPRIKVLAGRYGLPMELCSSPSPSAAHFYVSMVREYLSYIKMLFFDRAVLITRIT